MQASRQLRERFTHGQAASTMLSAALLSTPCPVVCRGERVWVPHNAQRTHERGLCSRLRYADLVKIGSGYPRGCSPRIRSP
jgi:hypothetical protein